MKVCQPDTSGDVELGGVRVHYDTYGSGEPNVVLIHGWQLGYSASWKNEVPYLAQRYRVVTLDLPGNGRSDRPTDPDAYRAHNLLGIIDAVLDAAGVDRAVFVGVSAGAALSLVCAATRPERVAALVLIGTYIPLVDDPPGWSGFDPLRFNDPRNDLEGWNLVTRDGMRRDYPRFARFFVEQVYPEAHSTKQIEDLVGWALETGPEPLIAFLDGTGATDPSTLAHRRALLRELCAQVHCPALVLHGRDDRIAPHAIGVAVADAIGAELVTFEGTGHVPGGRAPVRTNLLLREFIERLAPPRPARRTWVRPPIRPKRALYLSSPIGLGHARRDIAIATALRRLRPDLQIDWLAQRPVTAVLDRAGERIHPASATLASEATHFDGESGEHDLHVFQAFRRADELLVHNFLVFHDVAEAEQYDLVIGDEAWEVDYFLHENPELKRFAFAWLTDFVGYMPMPAGGDDEIRLAADYNAEMIEQAARYKRIRDAALFVGEPDDVVPLPLGPSLPTARQWVADHFTFPGYITGFDPVTSDRRAELRDRLGYRPDEHVCLVAVGGTATGRSLLNRIAHAFPTIAHAVDDLRMVIVTGPRIDPNEIDAPLGVETRGYVPDLHLHLAASDVGVVQGGLTTSMELVASDRPFVYLPLRNHFEQQIHVRHRLERHGATRCLDYATATPDRLAAEIAEALTERPTYLPVDPKGADRAAALLAELV